MAKGNTARTIKTAIAAAHRAIDEVRRRIGELKAERERISAAPVPFEVAAANLDAQIAELAKEYDGRYMVSALMPAGRVGAEANIDLIPSRDEHAGKRVVQMALAYFIGDKIAAKLKGELRGRYAELEKDGVAPLADTERAAALATLDEVLRAAEREEDELILEAEEAGITVPRRADTDPRIFLEVEGA